MISIRSISKWYGSFQVLAECSTEVAKGEVVVVCGPSGSGKSTLIKCVNGLEPFQKGEIIVNDISVGDPKTNLPKLRARVGMVFQHFELFPHMSVTDNLTLGQVKVLNRTKEAATEKAYKLLQRVGLTEHKDKYPGQLSGGQQQRVAIARALSMDPIAMLFDEPTSALDPEMINEVLDVMVELAQEGMTMMVVTHEMGFARKVGLQDKADAYPATLSGGQKQRVGIARALAMRPILLLFDEPTSSLDPELVGEVLAVMRDLTQEGTTMLVVTHEMGFARDAATRIAFMDQGRIVEDAKKEDFFGKPRSDRAQLFLSKILHH